MQNIKIKPAGFAKSIVLFGAMSLGTVGCASDALPTSSKSDTTMNTLTIASSKAVCFGLMQRLCLKTKADTQSDFEYFYNDIKGFDYQWGSHYLI